MTDYDAAVIGAGVHGASAAYHLAQRGLRTVVLERGHPADGPTTGRSSAICRAFYTNAFLARVAADSMRVLESMNAEVGGTSGFRRTGALFLHGADEVADVERTAHALQAAGIDVELVSPDDLAVRHPEIDATSVAVAVWEPGAGYADPVSTTTSYLDAARELGVEVRIKTSVVAVTPGSPVVIETSSGNVTAERVLLAAGPWTRHLAATFGVELPIHAERHLVASLRCGSASPPYIVADTVTGWYGKPDLGGHYLVGGLTAEPAVDADDVSERVTDDELLRYAGMFIGRFAELEDVTSLAGGWAGVYDVSPDWQPVIGEVATNVIVDCGSSGHGFKLAPVLGALIADLVVGDDVAQLAEFHPQRFVAGQPLAAGFGDSRILG